MKHTIKSHLIIILLLFLSSCSVFGTKEIPAIAKPNNIYGLFVNINKYINNDIFMVSDTYSEERIMRDFGANKFKMAFYDYTKPKPSTSIYLNDFLNIKPSGKSEISHLTAQVSLESDDGTLNKKITSAFFNLNIISRDEALTLENVTKIIGNGFVEDRDSEEREFFATSMEPFNPPAKPVVIIKYEAENSSYKKTITLNFGSENRLYILQFRETRK